MRRSERYTTRRNIKTEVKRGLYACLLMGNEEDQCSYCPYQDLDYGECRQELYNDAKELISMIDQEVTK